jgi:hypothetical protein
VEPLGREPAVPRRLLGGSTGKRSEQSEPHRGAALKKPKSLLGFSRDADLHRATLFGLDEVDHD